MDPIPPTGPAGSAAATVPPEQPAQPAEQKETPKEQKFVTEDQLAAAVEKGVRRAQQSAADRNRTIEARVSELAQQVSKFTKVTPEMQQQMVRQATDEVDQALSATSQESTEPETDDPGEGNPVYAWTRDYFTVEGLTIEKDDPEYKQIRTALDDPSGTFAKYTKVVMKAVEEKRQRMDADKEAADARTLGAGSGTSNALGTDVNVLDLFQDAHRK